MTSRLEQPTERTLNSALGGRPRLLDLFCGAGGAAMGYYRAGFDVTGVDIKPQPHYPFEFIQADALEILDLGPALGLMPRLPSQFHAIHASPPCQGYSIARNNGSGATTPKLIHVLRPFLEELKRPWVIENVEGAKAHMAGVVLCGASFGLGASGMDLPRHRLFETSFALMVPQCQHIRGNTMGVYGHGTNSWHREKIGRNLTTAEMRVAMDIDWMTRDELGQAIPPAYTEYVGRQILATIGRTTDDSEIERVLSRPRAPGGFVGRREGTEQ